MFGNVWYSEWQVIHGHPIKANAPVGLPVSFGDKDRAMVTNGLAFLGLRGWEASPNRAWVEPTAIILTRPHGIGSSHFQARPL